MGLTPALERVSSQDVVAPTTAEMLAALPEGLMVPAGPNPAERRVTDVLALYRAVFLNASEAIAIIDKNGQYLEQNVMHELLLGYPPGELVGQTPAIHIGEETFRDIAQELER